MLLGLLWGGDGFNFHWLGLLRCRDGFILHNWLLGLGLVSLLRRDGFILHR